MVNALEFKPEDPGLDPSELTLVQTCLCLNPIVRTTRAHPICEHVKDFISICRNKENLTASDMET